MFTVGTRVTDDATEHAEPPCDCGNHSLREFFWADELGLTIMCGKCKRVYHIEGL